MLVEVANSGIKWMEPRDLSFEEACRGINPKSGLGISSRHEGLEHLDRNESGANVAFADGSVRLFSERLAPETLKGMLTKAGGETVEIEKLRGQKSPDAGKRPDAGKTRWITGLTLFFFAVSAFLLLRRAWRSRKGVNAKRFPSPM